MTTQTLANSGGSKNVILACVLVLLGATQSGAVTIDFEGLADGASITAQYSSLGVTFANASAISAGLSLNESDFPPHSGSNVIVDSGGPIMGVFASPVDSFGGFFTYTQAITLTLFDINNSPLGSISSLFANNTTLGVLIPHQMNSSRCLSWGP